MSEQKMLVDGMEYTKAVATDVMSTFERQIINGKPWVRPSRDPEIIAKWKKFQAMHVQENVA